MATDPTDLRGPGAASPLLVLNRNRTEAIAKVQALGLLATPGA